MIGAGPCDRAVILCGAVGAAPASHSAQNWALVVAILGSSMAFIDSSVVSVALPAIQAALSAPAREAQWIVNAYTLMLGALILAGGAAGDRFGRRFVFVLGLTLFTAASIACGLARSATTLIVDRAVQGVGGALLTPASLALISATFAPQERGRAIGTWAAASALTTALGPVLGGWLVDAWSWRAIFFINVPLALVTVPLALWRVPETRSESDQVRMDWSGVVLITAALATLVYGLTAAAELGWTNRAVLAYLGASAATFIAFLWAEWKSAAPMVPLQLFRSRAFSGTNAMTLLLYFALGGIFFFLPFDLIQIQGYSALIAGAVFLPFTAIMAGVSRWSGELVDRYGARAPLIVGPVITALGYALLAVPGVGGPYWSNFLLPMAVLGFGMAVSVAPLTTTVMASVPDRYAGVASGVNNAVSRIAGTLAVAILGTLAADVFGVAVRERLHEVRLSPAQSMAVQAQIPKLAEAEAPVSLPAGERQLVERALKESFVASFRVIAAVAAALALAGALCAAGTVSSSKAGAERV
jgi:EmrB/QacA subfamily drug resistance transporter